MSVADLHTLWTKISLIPWGFGGTVAKYEVGTPTSQVVGPSSNGES